MNIKSSPIIPWYRLQYLSKTFLWHLPPRQSSEAAPANSVPVPENETSVRLRWVRRGWTLLPWSLATGNESDMVVRAMSDDMIKSWTRLTEGYANVGLLFRNMRQGKVLPDSSVGRVTYILLRQSYWDGVHYVTLLPQMQQGSLANKKYI